MPDDNSNLEPPDPISNSEVKRVNANGSAGSPCVRVGNRQAFFSKKASSFTRGLFFYLTYNVCMIIGLTGGIGSGKSAAADCFIELGIDVIDADIIAKNTLSKDSHSYNLFVQKFGESLLDKNKEVNRTLLRKEIFSNEIKKKELENIIHPIVRSKILDFINNSKSPYCIVMVPLIFETNSSDNYDRILLIDCDVETQIKRSSLRDNQSNKDIQKIISSQATRDERLTIADDVVLNSSSFVYLKNEIFKIHKKYMEIINNA